MIITSTDRVLKSIKSIYIPLSSLETKPKRIHRVSASTDKKQLLLLVTLTTYVGVSYLVKTETYLMCIYLLLQLHYESLFQTRLSQSTEIAKGYYSSVVKFAGNSSLKSS